MVQYILITTNKRGEIMRHIPSSEWLKQNNYNYKLLAEKLRLKNYKLINIKDLLEQSNDS